MKVFAQQLRSKPEFAAVFKVRQRTKAADLCVTSSGLLKHTSAGLHDRGLGHGHWHGPHLHFPLLASPGRLDTNANTH